MNNEEPIPIQTLNINRDEPARPMPEQAMAQVPPSIPRSINFYSLLHQWQPMGIRVVVNLPFVGDDQSILFAIRNGPYIPDHRSQYYNDKYSTHVFGFNAMNAVVQSRPGGSAYPSNWPVHISYFDSPPFLSQMSRCFRRWRGDMQYRIRVVAGFVTQGYIIVAPMKNTPLAITTMNEYAASYNLINTDPTSYRSLMQNAYIMSDTSFYRHVEITYPYEYPTPWYDQFQWIANRVSVPLDDKGENILPTRIIEPFSDNWLCVFFRGALEPTRDTAQMSFELEYRAKEGFQFADPGLPPFDLSYPKENLALASESWASIKTIPSTQWKSDGIRNITAITPPAKKQGSSSYIRSRGHRDADQIPENAQEMQEQRSFRTLPPPSSSQEPGEDTVDPRTPSQRRRDAEFSY